MLAISAGHDGKLASARKLGFALAGSELVRLAAERRIDVVDDRIQVLDATPTGDKLLDASLVDIQGGRQPRRAKKWVAQPWRDPVESYLKHLVAKGVVRSEHRKTLRIFVTVRWTVVESDRVAQARARLDAVAFSSGPVDAAGSALGALVHVAGLDKLIYPREDGEKSAAAQDRLKLIAKRDPTAATVREAAAGQAAVEASFHAALDASIQAAVTASVDAAHHAGHDGGAGGGHH